MSLNPVSTASPHKMIWWDESISRFLQSTFLEKGIHGEDEANRDIFKFYYSEPIKKRLYGYEAHDDPEAARKTLEENPEAFELNIALDVWLLLKQYSHSDNGFAQKSHFFYPKDQGNTKTCYAYASASALEGLWKLNLDVDSIVEVSELINCQPDSKDDDRGGYAEHCLRYVMTYGVDTVPMVDGSPVIEKRRRRRIDGYIKVPQFNIDYLLLAVAQQPVIATMAVGVKFHEVSTFEDVYKGEDPGTKLTNHSVTIDGFHVDKSTGIGVFKILNSFGEDWGVDGYGLVSIDPTRRQGVGNLYSNPMYPIIYENISPLDRLLMRYGNFYSLSHSGLPIPFRHRTRDGLQPHFHPVIMQSACRELGGVPQEVQVDCDVQEKRIEIANNNGEKLVGTLHETGSVRIVILCHDFPSTKESNTMVNLAVALGKEGTTAFRFDFSGNGESNGCFQYGDYWRQAEDLRAVVEHFNRGRRVTSAIVGHGKGGNVALLYASKYHDISTVVNVSGCYNLRRHIDECMGEDFYDLIEKDTYFDVKSETGEVSYRVTLKNLTDVLNTDMHEASHKIDKKCRVLTVHGSKDEIIPFGDGLKFARIISNHKIHIEEGADHGYTSHQAGLTKTVLRFIKGV